MSYITQRGHFPTLDGYETSQDNINNFKYTKTLKLLEYFINDAMES